MDANLRSLSTDLINIRESYFYDPKEQIINALISKKNTSKEKSSEPKFTQPLSPFQQKIKKVTNVISEFLGFNIIGIWGFLFFLTIIVWFQLFSKNGLRPKKWLPNVKNQCLQEATTMHQEIARSVFDCQVCAQLTSFPVETNMSRELFLNKYAYSRIPVIVRGGAKNWTAVDRFSFDFFKKLYDRFEESYEEHKTSGQFFPYKTEFQTLKEALYMSKLRRKMKWYFGWNNIHPGVAQILREHYERPYFLPPDSESSGTDWMFMGTGGGGAHSHLDYVNRPSWQAQIKGTKTWFLKPVPECEAICSEIDGTVTPGDIIVVDTNYWYHSTKTLSKISITIGSEYD